MSSYQQHTTRAHTRLYSVPTSTARPMYAATIVPKPAEPACTTAMRAWTVDSASDARYSIADRARAKPDAVLRSSTTKIDVCTTGTASTEVANRAASIRAAPSGVARDTTCSLPSTASLYRSTVNDLRSSVEYTFVESVTAPDITRPWMVRMSDDTSCMMRLRFSSSISWPFTVMWGDGKPCSASHARLAAMASLPAPPSSFTASTASLAAAEDVQAPVAACAAFLYAVSAALSLMGLGLAWDSSARPRSFSAILARRFRKSHAAAVSWLDTIAWNSVATWEARRREDFDILSKGKQGAKQGQA